MFRLALKQNQEIRNQVATAQTIAQIRTSVNRLKENFLPYHTGEAIWTNENEPTDCNLSLPPWICQPYIRMEPQKHIEHLALKEREAAEKRKLEYFDDDGNKISRNVMKKLQRASRNGVRQRTNRSFEICTGMKCANPTVSLIQFGNVSSKIQLNHFKFPTSNYVSPNILTKFFFTVP